MKNSGLAGAILFVFALGAIVCSNPNAGAQVTRPQVRKPAPATRSVTHANQQATNSIDRAWRHLARAYQDLRSTPADVKGDTSRLEAAIGAAADNLHQQQAALGIASPSLGREDMGRSREYIFNAVQQHLATARKEIEGSGIKSNHCEQALAHIVTAEGELRAARSAPVRK